MARAAGCDSSFQPRPSGATLAALVDCPLLVSWITFVPCFAHPCAGCFGNKDSHIFANLLVRTPVAATRPRLAVALSEEAGAMFVAVSLPGVGCLLVLSCVLALKFDSASSWAGLVGRRAVRFGLVVVGVNHKGVDASRCALSAARVILESNRATLVFGLVLP